MSEAPRRPRPDWLTIHAFEAVAWLGLLLAIAFLQAHGLHRSWKHVTYMVPLIVFAVAKVFVYFGLPVQVLHHVVTRQSLSTYLRGLVSKASLLLVVRAYLASLALWYAYPWLKVHVPLVNPALHDRQLWQLDSLVHLGMSPSLFLTNLFQGELPLRGIDWWYDSWKYTAGAGFGFFALSASLRTRRRFLFSNMALWTLGLWLYVALPALGPCYAFHGAWDAVRQWLPETQSTQYWLWDNYKKVLATRDTGAPLDVNPLLGIAAMPSLHVGVHWLLMLWARREARWLFLPFLAGAILTLLGSVVTGWHYLVDGYVGIALAHLAFHAGLATERDAATGSAGDTTAGADVAASN